MAVDGVVAMRSRSRFRQQPAPFEDEPVLPAHLLGPQQPQQGEKKLALAVLEMAVDDWRKFSRVRTVEAARTARAIRDWFWSEDRTSLYAFAAICERFDLPCDAIRRQLFGRRR